jgi:hypothetical protein
MDGQTEETLETFLGEPFTEVRRAARSIVIARISAVLAVARALGEGEAMALTHDEVRRIVAPE